MGDKVLMEQIIDTIKKHPLLYDKTLSCRKDEKEALWEEIADTFEVDDCKPAQTPMETGLKLVKSTTKDCTHDYRALIGCLMYIAICSRPDIAHAVSSLSQFNEAYDETHWKAAKRVLRYLKVRVLKVKWKNLRDCYKKHLRAQNDDSKTVSSYKCWHWSNAMEFLRPHVLSNTFELLRPCVRLNPEISEETDDDNVKNNSENTVNDIKLEVHTNFESDSELAECIVNRKNKLLKGKHSENSSGSDSDNVQSVSEQPKHWKKRRVMSNSNSTDVPSHSRRGMNEFDGIDLIFLGYAKSVKNMPLKRQISVKMKIAKIIMEEELKCLEQLDK